MGAMLRVQSTKATMLLNRHCKVAIFLRVHDEEVLAASEVIVDKDQYQLLGRLLLACIEL